MCVCVSHFWLLSMYIGSEFGSEFFVCMCVFLYAHHCVWIRAQMSIDSLFLAVSVCVCMCGCRGGTVKG